eukprot:GFUD01120196.1.p1 GENE.GFUD01120196.1~~GFUD01120196.1.p1  ORF type:complete len:859 (-),score=207.49 GFUD01120196.1:242-2818(-)
MSQEILESVDSHDVMDVESDVYNDDPAVEMDLPYLNTSVESVGNEVVMEEILLGKSTVELPSDLYENEELFNQFFSIDTWNDLLPEEVKLGLLNLLPSFPTDDIDEKAKTIEMLFGKDNFHFGNPVEKFRQDLLSGDYFPDNVEMKEIVQSAQKRNYEEWMENYHYTLVQDILDSRKSLLEVATGNVVTTPKIERKRGPRGGNMKQKIKKRYLDEITRIKREVGEDGLSSDDEGYISPKVKEVKVEASLKPSTDIPIPMKSESEDFKLMPAEEFLVETPLTQDMQPCFMSLLRDLFMQGSGHQLTMPQLDQSLTVWQESPIAALNPWYQECSDPNGWRSNIPSVIAFLCGSFPEQQPQDFVPYISVDSVRGSYQWVGAGRDGDAALIPLNQWWLDRLENCRAGFVSQAGSTSVPISSAAGAGVGCEVPAGNTTQWTVRPSTLQEKIKFQEEERLRYTNPTQVFQWTGIGYTATVGPVKGANSTVRPKNHIMLVPDRPPSVTILTLVRDAVSRLPNGEGTRTDIVELLKDSQYLCPNIDTGSLTTTVSGALDRLQNETDAPVKYDSNRKIWIYLHRARTMEDFNRLTQDLTNNPKQPRQRQKRKIKLDTVVPGLQQNASPQQLNLAQVTSAQLNLSTLQPQETDYPYSSKPSPSILETALAGVGLNQEAPIPTAKPPVAPQLSPVKSQAPKTVQKIIVKGTDGKVIPLSAATLQKLIEAGAIKPGTQIATPDFKPDTTTSPGTIRIVQHPNKNLQHQQMTHAGSPPKTVVQHSPQTVVQHSPQTVVQHSPQHTGGTSQGVRVVQGGSLVSGGAQGLNLKLLQGGLSNLGALGSGQQILLSAEQFRELQASGQISQQKLS